MDFDVCIKSIAGLPDTLEEIFIENIRKGDEAAWRQLYLSNYPILCKYALQFVKDPFLAENIVHEVMVRLWKNRAALEIRSSLRSYLLRAVRNACLDYFKKSSTRFEFSFPAVDGNDEEPYPDLISDEYPYGSLLEKELEDKIAESIEALPEESRKIFKMSRYEDKKYSEIASELGVSVDTVKYHIKKALSLLREALEKYF